MAGVENINWPVLSSSPILQPPGCAPARSSSPSVFPIGPRAAG